MKILTRLSRKLSGQGSGLFRNSFDGFAKVQILCCAASFVMAGMTGGYPSGFQLRAFSLSHPLPHGRGSDAFSSAFSLSASTFQLSAFTFELPPSGFNLWLIFALYMIFNIDVKKFRETSVTIKNNYPHRIMKHNLNGSTQ